MVLLVSRGRVAGADEDMAGKSLPAQRSGKCCGISLSPRRGKVERQLSLHFSLPEKIPSANNCLIGNKSE